MFAAPITKVAHNFFVIVEVPCPSLLILCQSDLGARMTINHGHGSEFHNGNTMIEDEGVIFLSGEG